MLHELNFLINIFIVANKNVAREYLCLFVTRLYLIVKERLMSISEIKAIYGNPSLLSLISTFNEESLV